MSAKIVLTKNYLANNDVRAIVQLLQDTEFVTVCLRREPVTLTQLLLLTGHLATIDKNGS